MTYIYKLTGEEIDINHPLFDVVIIDEETQTLKLEVTQDEIDLAKKAKIDYLIEVGSIEVKQEFKNLNKASKAE